MPYQIWAWGVLACQMLLRQLTPYSNVEDNITVALGVLDGQLDLRNALPTVGSPLRLALAAQARRCLHPEPSQRPTAAELMTALTSATFTAAVPPLASPPASPLAAAAAACAGAAGAVASAPAASAPVAGAAVAPDVSKPVRCCCCHRWSLLLLLLLLMMMMTMVLIVGRCCCCCCC
jgi:hypothetical protein